MRSETDDQDSLDKQIIDGVTEAVNTGKRGVAAQVIFEIARTAFLRMHRGTAHSDGHYPIGFRFRITIEPLIKADEAAARDISKIFSRKNAPPFWLTISYRQKQVFKTLVYVTQKRAEFSGTSLGTVDWLKELIQCAWPKTTPKKTKWAGITSTCAKGGTDE
ncbi:MAG: hypothetical protein K2P94_08580 [Rhodospirillaceae bacterium]|nr:hypothetical protein [Rhodospirillaceae bacterium]